MIEGADNARAYALAEFAALPSGVAFLPPPDGRFVAIGWGAACLH